MTNRSLRVLGTFAALGLGFATVPAQAADFVTWEYSKNECRGGFDTCYAHPDGTFSQGPGSGDGSPAIFKYNNGGSTEISSQFGTIDGLEFSVGQSGDFLSFDYTPGLGDPDIHYFAIYQASEGVLFYNTSPITSGNISLSDYWPNNPGFSHITFFDTGTSAVPEPATWAMMLLGFGFVGGAMRSGKRRRKLAVSAA